MQYYVFGSKSSIDTDIMVVVDKIPNVKLSHEACKKFAEVLQPYYKKKVNVNICRIEDGIVIETFKGTPGEVNNSLLSTYNLHSQDCKLLVTKKVERDKGLKFMRAARIILSFLSRTEHRKEIKRALRGDFVDKLDVLESIDFREITDLGNKKVDKLDFEKTVAFQLGQALGLIYVRDLYTKEEIAAFFPGLYTLLFRFGSGYHMAVIEEFKQDFIRCGRKLVPEMKTLKEK